MINVVFVTKEIFNNHFIHVKLNHTIIPINSLTRTYLIFHSNASSMLMFHSNASLMKSN